MESVFTIEKKVYSYLEKHSMLSGEDKLLLGVSGGADSVCLLFLMYKYCSLHGIALEVVHIHHGMRESAERDLEYVQRLCRELGLRCHVRRWDVPALAKEHRLSTEEAGRRARYESFEQIARETGATRIGLAHNSNDRAETMLFFLFRGTGIRGLSGIKPCRGQYIRPILCLTRQQIEAYLEQRGISYCNDETNEEDDYTRNRIRHHILPYAEKEISSGCVEHMNQTGEQLELVQEFLDQKLDEYKAQILETIQDGYAIQAASFMQGHELLQRMMVYDCLTELSPGKKDITSRHVDQVRELFLNQSGKEAVLPFGIRGYRQFDRVILERCGETSTQDSMAASEKSGLEEESEDVLSVLLAGNQVTALGKCFKARIFSHESGAKIPEKQYTKWFDCDKIKFLTVRNRRPGDRLAVRGSGGELWHKRLKEYFIAEKIPQKDRDELVLLADGDEILWVVGYRISEAVKVTEKTKKILEITVL